MNKDGPIRKGQAKIYGIELEKVLPHIGVCPQCMSFWNHNNPVDLYAVRAIVLWKYFDCINITCCVKCKKKIQDCMVL